MEYYFAHQDKINLQNQEIIIEGSEYRHLAKVLRKKNGDLLTLTDGNLNIYHCRILNIDSLKILCGIERTESGLYEPDVYLKLYMAPLRNLQRFEFAIEKAVELGIISIQPVITDFTISKSPFSESKMERFRKIILSAMSQSQRCLLPEFNNAITYDEMLRVTKDEKNKIAMYEFSDDREIELFKNVKDKISLFIGPEGGISKTEVSRLTGNNWKLKSLGKRKLRAETAAVAAVYEILSNS